MVEVDCLRAGWGSLQASERPIQRRRAGPRSRSVVERPPEVYGRSPPDVRGDLVRNMTHEHGERESRVERAAVALAGWVRRRKRPARVVQSGAWRRPP